MNMSPHLPAPKPLAALRVIRVLDAITEFTGTSIAWLTGIMVLIACIIVALRHLFGIGSVALQESVTYMHALVFMLGAAYALKSGDHVRVDIFHRNFSVAQRAWVEILGSLLFTLPLMAFIGWGSMDFVRESWRINEGSTDPGGLGGVYFLKMLLPLMAGTLGLQAIADLLRNLLVLMNVIAADDQNTQVATTALEQSPC